MLLRAHIERCLIHVIVDRDMLRHVLAERPKISKVDKPDKPPSFSAMPPLPRRTGGGKRKPWMQQQWVAAPAKRVRNGECWDWVEGRCTSRLCRFKHECANCGDKSDHAAVCPRQLKAAVVCLWRSLGA